MDIEGAGNGSANFSFLIMPCLANNNTFFCNDNEADGAAIVNRKRSNLCTISSILVNAFKLLRTSKCIYVQSAIILVIIIIAHTMTNNECTLLVLINHHMLAVGHLSHAQYILWPLSLLHIPYEMLSHQILSIILHTLFARRVGFRSILCCGRSRFCCGLLSLSCRLQHICVLCRSIHKLQPDSGGIYTQFFLFSSMSVRLESAQCENQKKCKEYPRFICSMGTYKQCVIVINDQCQQLKHRSRHIIL